MFWQKEKQFLRCRSVRQMLLQNLQLTWSKPQLILIKWKSKVYRTDEGGEETVSDNVTESANGMIKHKGDITTREQVENKENNVFKDGIGVQGLRFKVVKLSGCQV